MRTIEQLFERLMILKKAREILATPERWTQYAMARTSNLIRTPVKINSKSAGCFCAMGAIRKAAGLDDFQWIAQRFETAVTDWNDRKETTHEKVLAAFSLAIKQTETEMNANDQGADNAK